MNTTLADFSLDGKRVLVRADLNIPRTEDGTLLDSFRAEALLPTLQFIQKNGGRTTLIAHAGRPENQEKKYSLAPFVEWFTKQGFSVDFAATIKEAQTLCKTSTADILLVENLRFFEGEQKQDPEFAKELAQLGTIFVQDAFGALHREDTSIALLPKEFRPERRTLGPLVHKELALLNKLIDNPKQPFVLILGGSKLETKIPMIEHLLNNISALLLCPALVFTFLKAKGMPVGKSLVDKTQIEAALQIIKQAEKHTVDLIYPIDYLVTNNETKKNFDLQIVKKISPHQYGLSIGPATSTLFKKCILQAKTIFLNGPSGLKDHPETFEGTRTIFQALQQVYATKIIAGGDAVCLARFLGFGKEAGTFSTGGGAALTFLSGKKLPGIF